MDDNSKKDLNQITNKDLLKDFLCAITDFEKKLLTTLRGLTLCPEKVIHDYISGRKENYFSVFRYLLLSLFFSYLSYEFFFQPGEIGGSFYNTLKEGLEAGLNSKTASTDSHFILKIEEFNIFYKEFHRLMDYSFKLFFFFSLLSIIISFFLFFRKLNYNIASYLVASTFMASHITILVSIFISPPLSFIKNSVTASFISMIPFFMYVYFCFFRIGREKIKHLHLRSFMASALSVALILAFNILFGMALAFYVMSYLDSFMEKVI